MKRVFLLLLLFISIQPSALLYAGYTLITREQIAPKTIMVQGVGKLQASLNPGPVPIYPPTVTVRICAARDLYSADAADRVEVWQDSAGTATEAQVLAACPTVLAAKYQRLWEAASAWERRNISGVGLSILSLGVAAGKPKALAVAQWSAALWNGLYYPRKALISLDTEPDCDFSAAGDMPFSVPELSAEVWQ